MKKTKKQDIEISPKCSTIFNHKFSSNKKDSKCEWCGKTVEQAFLKIIKDDVPKVKEREKKQGYTFGMRWKQWRNPATSYLVEIFNSNGTTNEYIITTGKEVFMIKSRMYWLRKEDARFNLSMGQYKLFYDDDCPAPIDKKIYWKEDNSVAGILKKAFHAVTPHNFKMLFKQEYVKNVTESSELNRWMKMHTILSICNTVMLALMIIKLFGGFGA